MLKNKNIKKMSFLLISIFIIQILITNLNINNVLGYPTLNDLETTINAELNSNTIEMIGSSLITTGTHAFYQNPTIDNDNVEHEITMLDVSKVQIPIYETTNTENLVINNPTLNTNETLLLNKKVNEYTCDGGFDTIINLNITYDSQDNDVISLLDEDFSTNIWDLYNVSSTTIQYTAYLSDDTWTSYYNPDSNQGQSDHLTVGYWNYPGKWDIYIRKDIPYLFESKYAESQLNLYCTGGGGGHYEPIFSVYHCASFSETTVTYNNRPTLGERQYRGGGQPDVLGWQVTSLNNPSNSYALMEDTYNNYYMYAVYASMESQYWFQWPYITHYLNKFYQNTGSGYFYMQTATNQEMLNAKSSVYDQETYVTTGDHVILDCQTTSSEQLKIKFWNNGNVVKEYQVFPYGNTNYSRHEVDIPIDSYFGFDQISINGKFDNTEYFKCWDIKVEEHVGKNFFSHCYVNNFSYEVLGQNYTEYFELILDEDYSDHTSNDGNYVFYFDSSMFSHRTVNDDVIIHSQPINFTLTMNIERDVNLTVNAGYSSNSWVAPSVVGLKINGEEVSDESINSGYCALADFPENLIITSTSQVYFRLDITSLFSFTFDLDVISKTYLRKTFQLTSNHDINLTSIQFPETLSIKKIYLNNYDYDDDNPLTLNPKVEMAINSIFKLEVITYGEIYIPLDQDTEGGSYILYSENFGTDTGEMYHSYFFSDYAHDYSIDGDLYLGNEFPSEIYQENWSGSGWNLDYNSSRTTSSFSSQILSSTINTNTSVPAQPTDFNLLNGSSNWAGDLSSINGNYTTFNSTQTGHYPATYSFTNDTIGEVPVNWTADQTYGIIKVVENKNTHYKILGLFDSDATSGHDIKATQTFITSHSSGTIELYYYTESVALNCFGTINIWNGSTRLVEIGTENSKWQYVNSVPAWTDIGVDASANTWYHIRIDFECGSGSYEGLSADTFKVYINGVVYGAFGFISAGSEATKITGDTSGVVTFYYDSVGYSWDPNYNLGGNLNLTSVPALNFTSTLQFDMENEEKSFLFYSIKTNITQAINVSCYNFNNEGFEILNSSYFSVFSEHYLLLNSSYYNATHNVIIRIEGINVTNNAFSLYLEELFIHSEGNGYNTLLTKEIGLDFLTNFDGSEFQEYQKIFNISVRINYKFTCNLSGITYFAYLNETEMDCSGIYQELQYDFVFNNSFTLQFNITNGILEFTEMNYTLQFKCITLDGQYQIYQYFRLSPDFTIISNDITKEILFLNFTYNFISTPFNDLIYNNSITNNIFSYRINILGETRWIYEDFGQNLTVNNSPGINLTSILRDNGQATFNDITIEFYLSGHESSLTIDNLNISVFTNKIQLTETPRTDVNNVEFQEPMLAPRSYTYWYFENDYTINDVSLMDVETSETVSTFNINDSKYFFQESFYDGDLILGLIDYNPHWVVSYEVLINNGTYTRMRIDYKADFTINNVSIVLNLKNDGILNDNWTLGTQDSYTFKLTIPGILFTSTTQSFYIEGYSTIPYAIMSSYESDQNWNRIVVDQEINYAGFLTYPKYTQVFLLTKETDWTAYSVYYGSSVYSAETMNPSLIKVLGDGFDPDVSDSYLYFRTAPFKSVDFEFDGSMITITINCSIDVENAYFLYPFDPSGVHNLALYSSNNSISIQGLTDMGDFDGYLYFACPKIYSGITQIKISVNFSTPIEMIVQSVIIFVIAGIAIAGYYYIKRNEEKVGKLSKKIGAKLKEKLSRKKEEKGLKEISIKIKDDKLYLEDKR